MASTLRWRPQIAAVLGALAVSACGLGRPPSDDEMIAHLQRERAAFETIVRMMIDDRIVGELHVDALPGDSPERNARRKRYRDLVRSTWCRSVVRSRVGRIVFEYPYTMAGGGVAGTGFKDYVYAPTPPAPLRPALDADDGLRFEDTFRHVDGNWYLCRMRV